MSIAARLAWVHLTYAPTVFDPPAYNFLIDYIPGLVFGFLLIAMVFRDYVSEAWAVRVSAAPRGVTTKCHSEHGPSGHSRSKVK